MHETKKLITELDKTYTINRLIEILCLNEYIYEECEIQELNLILENICDYAVEQGIIEDSIVYRYLFDTKVMGAVMPRPREVICEFKKLYENSAKDATKKFIRE